MSWDGYIKNLEAGRGVCAAAICGLGGGVWAQSGTLKISEPEAKALADVLKSGDSDKISLAFQSSGAHISGVKYMYLRKIEGAEMWAFKKGTEGMVITKTNQAVIVVLNPDSDGTRTCTTGLETIAKYLLDSGY